MKNLFFTNCGPGAKPTENFYKMIEMRRQGISFAQIAREFEAHHSTVMYHCKKYGIEAPGKIPREKYKTIMDIKHLPKSLWPKRRMAGALKASIRGDKKRYPIEIYPGKKIIINRGKLTYAEYLKEDAERKKKLLLNKA